MRAFINFVRDVWSISSGKAFEEWELWSGPVTREKLERQREWCRNNPLPSPRKPNKS